MIVEKYKTAAKLIKEADAIAIFAGAGMGVDSGLDQFRGKDGVWTKNIEIDGHNIAYYDLMTHKAFVEMPSKAWALIASLTNKFNDTRPHEGYNYLLEMIKDKEYFVVTSNCDEHFQKAGFIEMNILECHGSIYYMQCMDIVEEEIWVTPEITLDSEKFDVIGFLPKCPNCDSNCRPNVLLFGDWFWRSDKSSHQQIRYNQWKRIVKEKYKNILAIEIGVGKTIPTVRIASENFSNDTYPLIRINPHDSETVSGNQISLPFGAKQCLINIYELFNNLS